MTTNVGGRKPRMAPVAGGRALLIAGSLALAAIVTACNSSSKTGSRSSTPTTANATTAVQALIQQGIAQADANMLSQAATTFNNVLLLSPKNVYALYNLGLVDQKLNNTAGALSYYNQALAADRTYTPAMYNKAIILESTNLSQALGLYDEIVALNPKASTAYFRMAIVEAELGKPVEANAARAKAIALDPSLAKYPLPGKCTTPDC